MTDESLILDIDIIEKQHAEEIAKVIAEMTAKKDKELAEAVAEVTTAKDKEIEFLRKQLAQLQDRT